MNDSVPPQDTLHPTDFDIERLDALEELGAYHSESRTTEGNVWSVFRYPTGNIVNPITLEPATHNYLLIWVSGRSSGAIEVFDNPKTIAAVLRSMAKQNK